MNPGCTTAGLVVEDRSTVENRSALQVRSAVEDRPVLRELWISLASLLRSYTALHGIHSRRQARVRSGENKIAVRSEEKWLFLVRQGAIVIWTRENGCRGRIEISPSGRLRSESSEEEMDMAAEAWARELMR